VDRRALRDVSVAGLAFAATLAILATRGFGTPGAAARQLDALGAGLALAAAAPLLGRRRWPATAYLISAAACLTLLAHGYPLDAPVPAATAAYAVALAYSGAAPARRRSALVAVNAFVPAVALVYASNGVHVWDIATEMLAWAAVFAGTWVAGDRGRLRDLRLAEARAYDGRVEAEADRERRLIAAHERTRIARELHDSAGHAINVILVQAGAARLLHRSNPPGSREAIETIERVARDTIGDIDRLVRALRDDDGDIPADPGALNELVERHREGGLSITADLPGPPPPLPRGVAWAAYRILQEALTNAARHGPGSAAVAVRFHHRRVEIDVSNPAPAEVESRPGSRGGHGIIGNARTRHPARRHPGRRREPGTVPALRGAAARRGAGVTSVLIADDDNLMRAGLRAVLSSDGTIEVVGEAADGAQAVERTAALAPDVVLMDVRMPVVDGIEATRRIVAAGLDTRILILTTFEDDDYVLNALRAGAAGFVLKRIQPEHLIAGIHTVAGGDALLAPQITPAVIRQIADRPVPDDAALRRLRQLTPRERDVLTEVARGLSNAEIAARLVVEESTVKTHMKRILTKLHLRDRIQAVILAYETGLIRPGEGGRVDGRL
jgi:DNA-binding NarL/FixJ family response regulator/signal transduction histidine kinase